MITPEEKIEILERWIETRIALDNAIENTGNRQAKYINEINEHFKANEAYQQMLIAEQHEEEQ